MEERIYLHEGRKGVYLDAYLPDGHAGAQAQTQGGGIPCALICPGGGYRLIGTNEGEPVARRFMQEGYAAFVLNYSVGDLAAFDAGEGFKAYGPVRDLAAAMAMLHGRAGEFGIDLGRLVLAGFSAGAHLSAAYCLAQSAEPIVPDAALPAALILAYPPGGDIDGTGPRESDAQTFNVSVMPYRSDGAHRRMPIFIWHAEDDAMVPFENSVRLDARLTSDGAPHRFFREAHGVHAHPFETGDAWFTEALAWFGGQGA